MEKVVGSSNSTTSGPIKLARKSHILQRQHPERRDWKCNICFKEYETEMTLREHEDIHITPFCDLCSKMFRSAKLLRDHQAGYHADPPQQSKDYSLSSSDDELNICEDLSLNKVKEEPIELVSEPEIENLLNHDPHQSSSVVSDTSPRHSFRSSDYYPDSSRALGIWRNFSDTPSSSFLNIEHSSVPIKMEPLDGPVDSIDYFINEILKKPTEDSQDTKLSLVAEEIPLQQNFWTQPDQQIQQEHEIWNCDICSRSFSTKQILQRHRIALHDQNKDFKCDQCDMWFSSSNNHELIKHVNEVHNGFKKFICDFNGCNKEFSRRDALKRHRQTHETQKAKSVTNQLSSKQSDVQAAPPNFSCFDCGLNFRYQTSLILHLKNHKV